MQFRTITSVLSDTGQALGNFLLRAEHEHTGMDDFLRKVTVAFAVGGEGSRLKHLTKTHGVQKSSFRLPNGDTMIERTVRMYVSAGVTDFVALVYHEADSIVRLLGDGSRLGATVRYSHDPGKPVGRGGALRHALDQGLFSESRHLIVHNPDDQLVGHTDRLLKGVFSDYLYSFDQGFVASVVVVPGTPYSYSGMMITQGQVTDISLYPFIPVPAHIGMTLFSPAVFGYLRTLFESTVKCDFESILLPLLAEKRLLAASAIPVESWIPVNDEKGLSQLISRLPSTLHD